MPSKINEKTTFVKEEEGWERKCAAFFANPTPSRKPSNARAEYACRQMGGTVGRISHGLMRVGEHLHDHRKTAKHSRRND